jgi:hypothetical protein
MAIVLRRGEDLADDSNRQSTQRPGDSGSTRTGDRGKESTVKQSPARWEAGIALLALAIAYAFVTSGLRLGPAWLLPLLVVVLLLLSLLARRLGRIELEYRFGLSLSVLSTVAVIGSIVILVVRLLRHELSGTPLLRDGIILWASNIVIFALWYWELDGGGPARRHAYGYSPTDFLFPRTTAGGHLAQGWNPSFVDYLFVAFTASSAFSPTDTMPISRRVKLLMMAQATMSMALVGVIVARAVNTLQ